jgi:uncharacterized protein YndB with AHSA1/START domain
MDLSTVAPVRLSVTVRASQSRAFKVFTERIGDWWPSSTHSIENDDVIAVEMHCRERGEIIERHKDGSEARWGVIETWEPSERLVFSWNPSYEQRPETCVEVTFTAVSDTETRVDLEHRGWEALSERGVEMRATYNKGWRTILDQFAGKVSE